MTSVIRCEAVSRRFRRTEALHALDLDVPEGSIFALIGPNGAGKTTLIKILLGLLLPNSGRAYVLGTDCRHLGPDRLAEIAFVSESQDLPEWMTVATFLRYLRPFYPRWDDALAADLTRQFELPPDRKLGQLSRGMRMKAVLASSLAAHPRAIILDEPFSGFDPVVRDQSIRCLLECGPESTIFVASHDLAEIENFASHIGFLDSGSLLFSEETALLVTRFRTIEVRLAETVSPQEWPASWIGLERSAALVRFIDTQYGAESAARIASVFPAALHVDVTPMTLREIFVALVLKPKEPRR